MLPKNMLYFSRTSPDLKMRSLSPKYLILLLMLGSCATTNSSFNKNEYRRSKSIATYSGMTNELEDGYLILKENGYFKFYQKLWMIINIKEVDNTFDTLIKGKK